MFSGGANYQKLKTNLRLTINRLKLLEKKKTELAQKARKEIADYIGSGKYERAKIRVEHIIREDYLVEAMEVVEMYCDLLLARFGLIQQMKELDAGLAEAISSIIWAAPRLQTDVAELKIIADQLTAKYGKPYAQACQENAVGTVSDKLMHKLSVQAPPKILVEKYLIEIAKNYNIEYHPDPQVLKDDECLAGDAMLIDFGDKNNLGGGGGMAGPPQPAGFVGYPPLPAPPEPTPPYKPFDYPVKSHPPAGFVAPTAPSAPSASFNIPPSNSAPPTYPPVEKKLNTDVQDNDFVSFDQNIDPISHDVVDKGSYESGKPQPLPRGKPSPTKDNLNLPDLPAVPTDSFPPDAAPDDSEEIDFDDLTKRFEELKKKK